MMPRRIRPCSSPHPPFGHLLPQAGEGKCRVLLLSLLLLLLLLLVILLFGL
jgi:hypothetical protein